MLLSNEKRKKKNRKHSGKYDHILLFTPTKKEIEFPFRIRFGVCKNCGRSKAKGEISTTQLHHKDNKYDLENPLWNTIEVCLECHEKLDPKLRALKMHRRYWSSSNANIMRCPTCTADAIFGKEGAAPYFMYKSRAGFRSEKDYSFNGITIKAFKCPTCQRGRLFTPFGAGYSFTKKALKKKQKQQRAKYRISERSKICRHYARTFNYWLQKAVLNPNWFSESV